MGLLVDLHTHTTCSDGQTPPRELIRLARNVGLGVIAVTDHDSVEALPECLEEGRSQGIRVLPGIELSSRFEGRDVHVLGLGIDFASERLRSRLAEIQDGRRVRVVKICQALGSLGVSLDPALVLSEAGGKSVGRRHVARALVKKGFVRSIEEAFGKYLGEGSPANVAGSDLSPADAARLVRDHGGVASLAHPGFLKDGGLIERILDSAPIRAIEVYHRYRSSTLHLRFLDLARRRMLRITGGSDFHGDEHPHNGKLGVFVCPPDCWKDLEIDLRGL